MGSFLEPYPLRLGSNQRSGVFFLFPSSLTQKGKKDFLIAGLLGSGPAGIIVLCSWARHFILTVPHSTWPPKCINRSQRI